MLDLMKSYGGRDARLMMLAGSEVRVYRGGRVVSGRATAA
jgi:hypothetical protein